MSSFAVLCPAVNCGWPVYLPTLVMRMLDNGNEAAVTCPQCGHAMRVGRTSKHVAKVVDDANIHEG